MTNKEFNDFIVNKKLTLGSIESFTGGLFASEITSIPGASGFFKGSLVTYYTEEKERLLKIEHSLINKFGVVSKEIASEMAIKGKALLNTDICVSFTGNAGPGAMENKPAGEIYIGLCIKDSTIVISKNILGDREFVRAEAVKIAKEKILEILKK